MEQAAIIGGQGSERGICLQRGIRRREATAMVGANEPIVRILNPADLPRCVELSTEAHWNQTAADWLFLIEQAHAYGLELPEEGLVATTVGWDLGAQFTWINMVLVTAACRGRGFARRLLERALEDAKARGMTAALDATGFGAPVYERMGFSGDEWLVRLKGESIGGLKPDAGGDGGLVLMTADDLPEVAALDAFVLGVDRSAMIQAWWQRLPEAAWCLRSDEGDLAGCILARPGRVATQLGPLVCGDANAARRLVSAAMGAVTGPILMDVAKVHGAWIEMLEENGFTAEREFLRMGQVGTVPATRWSKYFAVAGPDFA